MTSARRATGNSAPLHVEAGLFFRWGLNPLGSDIVGILISRYGDGSLSPLSHLWETTPSSPLASPVPLCGAFLVLAVDSAWGLYSLEHRVYIYKDPILL